MPLLSRRRLATEKGTIACEVIAIEAVKNKGSGCGAPKTRRAQDRRTVTRMRSGCLTPEAAGRAGKEPPW